MGMRRQINFILFLAFFCSLPLRAAYGPRDRGYWALDGGAYLENVAARIRSSKTDVSSLTGYLRLRKGFYLSKKIFLEPSLGLRLPWRTNPDGGASIFTLQFDLDLLYRLFSFLQVKAGPGIQSLLFIGGGGAVVLNNGTGTSTFYNPRGAAVTVDLTVQAGLVFDLSRRVNFCLETIVSNLFNSQQRIFNAVGTVGVKF